VTQHTLKLVNTGTKNTRSAGTFTDIDRFVTGGRSFEHNDTAIDYGPWLGVASAEASGGTYRVSSQTEPLVFGDFLGPAINLVTATGPNFGKALVEVHYPLVEGSTNGDLVKRVVFELSNPETQWQVVKSVVGLDPTRQYTLVIASDDGKPMVFDAITFES
jgi:hypothetical protein